jgi:hypothetical protein
MGARPLRRVIQQKVEDPLSDALLAGDFSNGDVIVVDLNGDGDVVLRREKSRRKSRIHRWKSRWSNEIKGQPNGCPYHLSTVQY